MRRQLSWWVLLASFATTAFILSSCSTVSSRIEADRPAFDALSPQDRALVTEGKIRGGMSPQAVYLAWGGPRQKTTGMVHDQATETWVYTATSAAYGPYVRRWRVWRLGLCQSCFVCRSPQRPSFLCICRRSLLGPVLLSFPGDSGVSGKDGVIPKRPRGGVPSPRPLLRARSAPPSRFSPVA